MPQDPYAAYGGQVVNDPYKAYGGSVATASMEMTPESLGVTPGLPGSKPAALQGAPTFTDRLHATSVPGSFEGHPENMAQYVTSGPGEVLAGTKDIVTGKVAKGAHRVISGVGATAMPMSALVLPAAAMAAPISTAAGVGGGIFGGAAGQKIAETVGATPDQASLAGDVGSLAGGIAGGIGATKAIDLLKAPASRVLLLGKTPQGAYESALKPSTTLSQAQRDNIVNTGLNEGIPVSKGGAQKLSDLIAGVNADIKKTIATNPDAPITRDAAMSTIPDLKARFSKQVAPSADLKAIDAVVGDYQATQPATIRAEDAQAIKQGTYQRIGDRGYGEVGSATTEAEKALARGLKDEIATQFPELKDLNARDSKLYDLQPVLERAVARNGNHQLLGIGTPVAAAATKAVTGSNKAAEAAAVIKAVLDNPAVKSRLAIALIHSGLTPEAAVQRLGAYAGALSQQSVRGSAESSAE